MDMNIVSEGQVQIIAVDGRMDAMTVKDFETLAAEVNGRAPERLLVDFARLEYISSAGLRGVLNLAKACQAAKRPLGFCALTPMVAEVFRISGLTSILRIFSDRAAALADL
jgi:anti-anti-sigma factor